MTIHIYAKGLVNCSVCAPQALSADEVAQEVNVIHPTGLDWGWAVDESPTFKTGQSNPCQCDTDDTRRHWLLSC